MQTVCFFYLPNFQSVHILNSDPDRHHVPDPKDYNSLMDLLSLAFLGIMSNALDFKTYRYPGKDADEPLSPEELSLISSYDLNSMDGTERTLCMYVRGLGRSLVTWVVKHYGLQTPDGQDLNIQYFYTSYVAHMASAILRSKSQTGVQKGKGAPGCTYERLKSQIDYVFLPNTGCGIGIQRKLEDPTDTLEQNLTVIQRSVPVPPIIPPSTASFIHNGRSMADERYEKGVESNFRISLNQKNGRGSVRFLWNYSKYTTQDSDADMEAKTNKRRRR